MKQRKSMIRFQHPERLEALIDNLGLTKEALEKRLRDFYRARKLDVAKEDPNLPRRTSFQSDSLSLKSVTRALQGKSLLRSKAQVLRFELEARADEVNPDLRPVSWSDMGAIEGGGEEDSDSAYSKLVHQAAQGGKVSRRIIRQFGVAAAGASAVAVAVTVTVGVILPEFSQQEDTVEPQRDITLSAGSSPPDARSSVGGPAPRVQSRVRSASPAIDPCDSPQSSPRTQFQMSTSIGDIVVDPRVVHCFETGPKFPA